MRERERDWKTERERENDEKEVLRYPLTVVLDIFCVLGLCVWNPLSGGVKQKCDVTALLKRSFLV